MKKVSIILASYNRAHMVEEAIMSCLNQTYKNIELIVIDDSSSDNSPQVIQKLCQKDKRIKLIENKTNKKLPASLNIAFNSASGDYLTWTSDDNLYDKDAIKKMVELLEKDTNIGLVYTDYTTINSSGQKIARIYQEPPEYLPIRYCIGPCFLYRSEVAKEVGKYNEDLALIEDYEFFLRMGLKTQISHIPKSYYLYRIHPGSLTATRKKEIRKAKLFIKEKYGKLYNIPTELKPIYDLYMWFIKEKNFGSYFSLIKIVVKNPIITLSYIIKNLVRLKS